MPTLPRHNWSGWPGAWCLNCGCGDPYELGMADGWIDFKDDGVSNQGLEVVVDPAYVMQLGLMMICPEPGSNRHNPYITNDDLRRANPYVEE